jgi:hypothetical protein
MALNGARVRGEGNAGKVPGWNGFMTGWKFMNAKSGDGEVPACSGAAMGGDWSEVPMEGKAGPGQTAPFAKGGGVGAAPIG